MQTNVRMGRRGTSFGKRLKRVANRAASVGAVIGSALEFAAEMRDASPQRQRCLANTWARSLRH